MYSSVSYDYSKTKLKLIIYIYIHTHNITNAKQPCWDSAAIDKHHCYSKWNWTKTAMTNLLLTFLLRRATPRTLLLILAIPPTCLSPTVTLSPSGSAGKKNKNLLWNLKKLFLVPKSNTSFVSMFLTNFL